LQLRLLETRTNGAANWARMPDDQQQR
jgi:hypothetical protein